MDIYASDEEKGEEIKQWWRDNGASVLIGLILAAAILLGGRYWISSQQAHIATAAHEYQQINVLLAENKMTEAQAKGDYLFSNFSATPYATFAAFDLAKYSLADKDISASKSYLEWVIQHAELKGQVETARLRLTELLLEQGEHTKALELIGQSETAAFKSLFDELSGDIYLAQGQQQNAEMAYQTVLDSLQENDPRFMIVKLKLDDVRG